MWKIEIEKVSSIFTLLEANKARLELELVGGGYSAVRAREPELYITYLEGAPLGPYPLSEPCGWGTKDRATLLAVLSAAAQYAPALAVYARAFLSARDRRGTAVFPVGRLDVRIGYRIATALPPQHPALAVPNNLKAPKISLKSSRHARDHEKTKTKRRSQNPEVKNTEVKKGH